MTTYADEDALAAYLAGTDYTAPTDDEATNLLAHASELIDTATRGKAAAAYDGDITTLQAIYGSATGYPTLVGLTQAEYQAALSNAACAQVEFWLEFGVEHDIVGLAGAAQSGRLMISRLPPRLGPRTMSYLVKAGLVSARAWIR